MAAKVMWWVQNETPFLETTYSLFLTATCMTIFEVVFAYVIAFPGILGSVTRGLESVPVTVYDDAPSDSERYAREEMEAFVSAVTARERGYLNKLNLHSKVFAGMLITTLILCTVRFRVAIIDSERRGPLWISLKLAMTTVGILVLFQVCFFFMANAGARPPFLKSMPTWKFDNPSSLLPAVVKTTCAGQPPTEMDELFYQVKADLEEYFSQQYVE